MDDKLKLSKAETVALWHAVEWMDLCLRQKGPGTAEQIDSEKARLKIAKQALRKVNAIRKAQATPLTLRQREVLQFLDGAGTLDGHWFDPDRKPKFWWRTALREAFGDWNPIPSEDGRRVMAAPPKEPKPARILRLLTEAQAMRPHETTLAVALEFRREAYELSKSEFAAILGLSLAHYGEILNGRRDIPKGAMRRAYAIGVPAGALLQPASLSSPSQEVSP